MRNIFIQHNTGVVDLKSKYFKTSWTFLAFFAHAHTSCVQFLIKLTRLGALTRNEGAYKRKKMFRRCVFDRQRLVPIKTMPMELVKQAWHDHQSYPWEMETRQIKRVLNFRSYTMETGEMI